MFKARPKFKDKENVEIVSGFYKGIVGTIAWFQIRGPWFNQHVEYGVEVPSSPTGSTNSPFGTTKDPIFEDELISLDKQKEDFNKKLQKLANDNS